jgi:signal transduction histidine kinase
MKIRTKITLIVGALVLVSLVLVLWQYLLERERVRLYLDGVTVEEQESFGRLLNLSGSRLALFASDYTAWDDMVAYVHDPDPAFAEENIDVSLSTFNASEVYVYTADRKLLYGKNIDGEPVIPPAFILELFDRLLENRLTHFFAEKDGVLTEFRIATIHPSDDLERLSEPQGLFVVAKQWDAGYVATLEQLSGTRIVSSRGTAPDLGVVSVSFPYAVKDWDDKTVETFTVVSPLPVVSSVEQSSTRQLWVVFGSYAILLLLVYIFLHILVGRPIEALSAGIERKDIRLMKGMQKSRSEFGTLAKLVLDFSEYERKEAFERSKRDFITLVSHELRTPLTSLRWGLEKLTSERRSPANVVKTTLPYMSSAIERIMSLISAIVDVSKIETGSVIAASAPVKILSLIEWSVESLRPVIEAKKLTVTTTDATGGRDTVMSDERLLSIIINNVVSNAVRYGGEHAEVRVILRREETELMIEVINTGPGIPLGEQPQIFTKMFRAANAKLLSPDGVGLGLYISKSFLERLGGSITFTSVPDKETVFSIRVPLKPTPPPANSLNRYI